MCEENINSFATAENQLTHHTRRTGKEAVSIETLSKKHASYFNVNKKTVNIVIFLKKSRMYVYNNSTNELNLSY
jgi:hypothetical protein